LLSGNAEQHENILTEIRTTHLSNADQRLYRLIIVYDVSGKYAASVFKVENVNFLMM
jgi:hypothetical protein